MSHDYHDGQRALQDRFDTRRLADRLDAASAETIDDAHRAFIEADDDPLLEEHQGAQLVVRVRATDVFANCRRYVHRRTLVEASPFVPSATGEAPVPDWKREPWFDGALPAGDPAHDPAHPSAPATPEF